jgi:hypothetical protein
MQLSMVSWFSNNNNASALKDIITSGRLIRAVRGGASRIAFNLAKDFSFGTGLEFITTNLTALSNLARMRMNWSRSSTLAAFGR